uniref:TUB like protein 2 n=1 Tax=Propithecus coquereli TaxID=379532 RepID=A0A2K6F0W7_PROCO
MSEENETWKKDILVEELAALRLQKLEQQWRLFEKKQRRKRQEPLMVQANPDASLRLRRLCLEVEHRGAGDRLENPFFQERVTEAHLSCGACRVPHTVTCGGDGSGERGPLASPTEAVLRSPGLQPFSQSGLSDGSDSELEEVCLEDVFVSPTPDKQPPRTPRRGWMWQARALRASVEEKSESQDVGDEFQVPNVGPNPGMDSDLGPNPGMDDLEEKKAESESAETNSPAAANQEVSKALEGRVGAGRVGAGSIDVHMGESMEAYVLQPVLPGLKLQCLISRNKHGVDKGTFPSYFLFLEHLLLAGRKRKRSKTSNYLISMDSTDLSRNGVYFVGKLSRSNVFGTKFTIFDNGANPNRQNFLLQTAHIRQELGVVCYETNILGSQGPRKMTVIIPAVDSQNQRIICQPQNAQESILSRYQQEAMQGLILLKSKTPLWSEESGSYVLNFQGRVTRASVKNFQIVHPNNPGYVVLQFGRVAQDMFTMDFCYPLCPLQAFAICLSSLD